MLMDIVDFLGILFLAEIVAGVYSAIIGYSEDNTKAEIIYWISLVLLIATGIPMAILSRI